jgi:hypothetical protein
VTTKELGVRLEVQLPDGTVLEWADTFEHSTEYKGSVAALVDITIGLGRKAMWRAMLEHYGRRNL